MWVFRLSYGNPQNRELPRHDGDAGWRLYNILGMRHRTSPFYHCVPVTEHSMMNNSYKMVLHAYYSRDPS